MDEKPTRSEHEGERDAIAPTPRRARARRIAAWVVLGGMGLFALVLTTVIVSFTSSQRLRGDVLTRVLERVIASLPGTIDYQVGWPELNVWRLRDVTWTVHADTLVTLARLDLGADLGAALHRRMRVTHVEVQGLDLRLPALTAALKDTTAGTTTESAVDSTDGTLPWFDPGRLEGVPDLRVDAVRLRSIRIRTATDDLVVESFDGALDLDPRSARPWIRAELHAAIEGLAAFHWKLESTLDDSVAVRFRPLFVRDRNDADAATAMSGEVVVPRALIEGARAGALEFVRWHGDLLDGELGTLNSTGTWSVGTWDAQVDFVAPRRAHMVRAVLARAHLDTLAQVRRVLDTWPEQEPYALRARASGSGVRSLAAELDLDVQPWLQRAHVAGRWDGARATIDTVAIARDGLEVSGAGWVDSTAVDARMRWAVDSDLLARAGFALPLQGHTVRARGNLQARGPWPLPAIDLALDGSVRGELATIPAITVRARHRTASTWLDVRTQEATVIARQPLDAAWIRFDGSIDAQAERARGTLQAEVSADTLALALTTRLDASTATGVDAVVDSMRARYGGVRAHTSTPFAIAARTDSSLTIEGLVLHTDPGEFRLDARATPDSAHVDAAVDLALGRAFLETLLPDSLHTHLPADTTRARAQVALRGPLRAPSLRVHLETALEGTERWIDATAIADLWVRGEGALPFDDAPASLPARGAATRVRIVHAATPWIELDAATAGRLDLIAQDFVVGQPESGRVEMRALGIDLDAVTALTGAAMPLRGLLRGTLRADLDRAGASADVDLDVLGFGMQQDDGHWWESDVALRLDGRGGVDGTVEVDSLHVRTRFGAIAGHAVLDSARVDLTLGGDLVLPRAVFETLLANALDYDLPADTVAVRLDLRAEGPIAAPSARADLTFGLRGSRELPPLTLRSSVWMRGDDDLPWMDTTVRDLPERGLLAHLHLAHADSVWVELRAIVPARIGVRPAVFGPIEGQPLRADLRTRTLDVARLATLAGLGRIGKFTGDLRVELDAEAFEDRARLSGAIDSRRVRVELPDGSWLQTRSAIRLSGDSEQPRVDGGITVEGGVLRLPDVPPPLHDAQGDALLWEKPQVVAAVQQNGSGPEEEVTHDAEPARAFVPEVDVTLSIPGNLRLRGTGLDVELSGALTARTRGRDVAVLGELRATRGTYDFLGRRFAVQSGRVEFFGDLDPQLDLRLATTMQSNVYYVDLRGTALQPRFELSSDPPQSEGDIVSALLFGRPIDQLDEGQTELLRQRTREVATQLGANLLAQRVGQQIGVDVLSLQPSGEDGARALVVGKYLSPDVLVQYEQVLEEGRAALVRIEYALSRFFKIETTATQGEHSGIELKWSRDY